MSKKHVQSFQVAVRIMHTLYIKQSSQSAQLVFADRVKRAIAEDRAHVWLLDKSIKRMPRSTFLYVYPIHALYTYS